ncbi:BrnT family toxin [Leptolyngbya sp. 7M]|nr:BrnT family toxin [Leptolyngbya sp. 7M]
MLSLQGPVEWDEQKARVNQQKHGVSFDEAESVFYDENARFLYDANHSSEEERYILLGMIDSLRLLVVCHTYREEEEIIRIFSARKANKRECQQYRSFLE